MPDTRQNPWEDNMIYELQFEAQSPIHIGYKKIGTLKTTRYYIPGKAIWGALTAHITRSLYENPFANHKNYYKDVGTFIKTYTKPTYFFPKVNDTIYYPHYTEKGLTYGAQSKSEFEQKFIYSRVGTAIDTTGTAEDRSLHETEYIRDTVKDDIKKVHWVGYCIVEEKEAHGLKITELNEKDFFIESETDNKILFSDCIQTLTVGGERNYGFGKLHLKSMKKSEKIFDNKYEDEKLTSSIALGHVAYEPDQDVEYLGDLEPVVGRDWSSHDNDNNTSKNNNRGTGQKSTFCDVCFVPGTLFKDNHKFEIGGYGIMKIV
jgi:hypothetical protein